MTNPEYAPPGGFVAVLGPIGVGLPQPPTTGEGPIRPTGFGPSDVHTISGQQGLVLGLLTAAFPRVVATDTLVEALWPNKPPRSSATGLRVVINRLRERLAVIEPDNQDPIAFSDPGYQLTLDANHIDHLVFVQGLASAQRVLAADPDEAVRRLEAVLQLWRGPAYSPHEDNLYLIPAAAQLEARRAETEELLLQALLDAGRNESAAVWATAFVATEPYRERRWELLMLALYRAGRQAEALQAAERMRSLLIEDLGVEPGPAVKRLELDILNQAPHLDRASAEPLHDQPGARELVENLRRRPTVIPHTATTYVAPDGAPGAEVLSRSPMVTLVGPPGVGKSRLAARLAQDSGIADIYWLDLADETFQRRPDETIRSALAGLLGVRPTAQRLAEAAGEVLAGSPTLIVFDNADRMADVVAEWSEELLEACPDLRVVVTSRFALGSRSEKVFTVDPLQPDLAVELLLDRAPEAGVNSHDELTRLVEQVDRIPLGIELIAPHLAALDAEEVADRLAQSLELASGRGRLDARHRSLEQALAWSADLLDDVDRDLLATMTVHNGSVTPQQVVELMGGERPAVLAGLQRLNQYGLVRPTSRGRGQRWSTPNSVRTYVRTRLVAERELAQRLQAHAEHHLGRVVDLAAELAGEREERAVAELRKLADQLPAAHHWFVERGRVRESADFSLAMWEYGFFRQDYATYDWLLETLELDGVDQLDDHPEILGQGALAAWAQDRLLLAERLATQAESEAGRRDQPVPIAAHKARFNVAAHQDRTAEAARMLSLMLEVSEERGDVRHHSDNLVVATLGYGQVGLIEEARATAWRAYELVASLGNPTSVSWARVGLGWADMVTDPDRAAQTFAAAARLARTVDNRWVNGMATTGLVTVLRRQGRFDQARRLLIEVTDLWVRARQHGQISRTCQEAILLLARDGASVEDRNRAALLLERFTLEANRLQLLPDDQERFTGLATELAVPATSASGDVPLGRLVIEALVG